MEVIRMTRKFDGEWIECKVSIPRAIWRQINVEVLEEEFKPGTEQTTEAELVRLGVNPKRFRNRQSIVEPNPDGSGTIYEYGAPSIIMKLHGIALFGILDKAHELTLAWVIEDWDNFDDDGEDEEWLTGTRGFRCEVQ